MICRFLLKQSVNPGSCEKLSLSISTFDFGTVSKIETQKDAICPLLDSNPIPTQDVLEAFAGVILRKPALRRRGYAYTEGMISAVALNIIIRPARGRPVERAGDSLSMNPKLILWSSAVIFKSGSNFYTIGRKTLNIETPHFRIWHLLVMRHSELLPSICIAS